ncbi:hypothetical protein SAMN05421493_10271 [Pseudobutyrivibrio sp. 49]|uniref:DUF6044 family protein n=1 Tax=Pseudobutyrivibrio sp. 49 TaxID=1855344 RepID=UPI00088804B2|nr:DUF6044 family protein [Pseudobutyrivibrio sp. 49]SDH59415.1 hypothetical protein SAMN05421493_10271 [Pseudobutyrivibrio sp. 49]
MIKKKYLIGVVALLALYVLYMIKGEGIIINYVDQLDGEVIYYMLRSQSLDTLFQTHFSQFMDGNAEVSVASFGTLLFYAMLPPVYAFITNMFFVRIIAFLALYFLLKEYDIEEGISFAVALLYVLLPIFTVYGLTAVGVPLVWLALKYKKGERKLLPYILVAVYGLFSSLVLFGYAVLGGLILYDIILMILYLRNPIEQNKNSLIRGGIIFIELLCIYILTNIELLVSIFKGDNGFVSHKSQYTLWPGSFGDSFTQMLLEPHNHIVSTQKSIILVMLITVIIVLVGKIVMKKTIEKSARMMILMLFSIVFMIVIIAVLYAFYHCQMGIDLRNKLFAGTPLLAMQFDRFYWFYPCLWYMILGFTLSILKKTLKNRWIIILLLIIPCWNVYIMNSDLLQNLKDTVVRADHNENTWGKFYDEKGFSYVLDYIDRNPEEYRVISVGIHPVAAQYNGFYTLDGYSNNYDVHYKERFGNAIAEELNTPYLEAYFWEWGNRCYAFTNEYGAEFYDISSDEPIELDYNWDKLKEMGCEYVISRYQLIVDTEKVNFEQHFTDSYYGLYLYRVL